MHSDFDHYGIGCMKLFAQRLLQHSWALSPNECWPFCFFLGKLRGFSLNVKGILIFNTLIVILNSDDDVTQFKKWNIGQNSWDDISLYSLLIELEQRIPIGEYPLFLNKFADENPIMIVITYFRHCHGWISRLESSRI